MGLGQEGVCVFWGEGVLCLCMHACLIQALHRSSSVPCPHAGVSALSALSRLQQLELGYSGVSDEGLGALLVSRSASAVLLSVVFVSFLFLPFPFFSFSFSFLRAWGPAAGEWVDECRGAAASGVIFLLFLFLFFFFFSF